MKIKTILLRNFKGYGSELVKIDFSNVNLLFGKNSSGKTTVFHAISVINELMNQAFIEGIEKNDLLSIKYMGGLNNLIHCNSDEFEVGIILTGEDFGMSDFRSAEFDGSQISMLKNAKEVMTPLNELYFADGSGISFTIGRNNELKTINLYLLNELFVSINDGSVEFNLEHPIYDEQRNKKILEKDFEEYLKFYNDVVTDYKYSGTEVSKLSQESMSYNPDRIMIGGSHLFSEIHTVLIKNQGQARLYHRYNYFDSIIREYKKIFKPIDYDTGEHFNDLWITTFKHHDLQPSSLSYYNLVEECKKNYGKPFNKINTDNFHSDVKELLDKLTSEKTHEPSRESLDLITQASNILKQLEPTSFSYVNDTCNYLFSRTYNSILETLNSIIYIGPLREIPKYINSWSFESHISNWYDSSLAWKSLLDADDKALDILNDKLITDLNTPYQLSKKTYVCQETNEKVSKIILYDTFLKKELKFTDIGTGISQLLPIYVAAICNDSSIILSEQPELHMHPSAQLPIMDMAIDFSKSNDNQFLFETHSEHLLLRMQKRIREHYGTHRNDNEDYLENLKVNYFDKSKGKTIIVSKIKLTKSGDLVQDSIPDGFFEESLNELF